MGCNASVESSKTVNMGRISYMEGELIEIDLPQFGSYELGEPVKIVIYSSEGLISFETTVIAKGDNSVFFVNSPDIQRRFLKRRQFPRLDISVGGFILSISDEAETRTKTLDPFEPMEVTNLSEGGVGFLSALELPKKCLLYLELKFETSFLCKVDVVHTRFAERGFYYGCSFRDLPPQQKQALRAFILRKQIEQRFAEKRKQMSESGAT